LLEPNGKKNGRKNGQNPVEEIKEVHKKGIHPILKIIILLSIVVVLIIVSVILYQKVIYKPSTETRQIPINTPIDSTKVAANDSVIFADTNKMKETIEEDIVYDEDGIIIKESEKGFYIQLGNYENQLELAKKIKELKGKKIFPTYEEVTIEKKQIFRLRIGPYKTLEKAKSIIPKLQ